MPSRGREAGAAEHVREAVRRGVERGVGHDLAARRHDVGGLVGMRRGVGSGMQRERSRRVSGRPRCDARRPA